MTFKAIKAGEEVLDNYMTFAGDIEHEFWEIAMSLREECSGSLGLIEQRQSSK